MTGVPVLHVPGGAGPRTVQALEQAWPGTVAVDRLRRRWVKQPRPFAVPWLADWRCTDRQPEHLWATAAQLVDVLDGVTA